MGKPQARPNEIGVEQCESWDDFRTKVRETRSPHLPRMFRGQSKTDWKLQSKWDRYAERKAAVPEDERAIAGFCESSDSLLERFKGCFVGAAGFDTSTLGPEQWMALARNHGLITPLLDWTRSPFIAAFFAFRELLPTDPTLGCLAPMSRVADDGYVAVWELTQLPDETDETDETPRRKEFSIIHARNDFAARQRAQSGLFTLIESHDHTSVESYLESKKYAHLLTRFEIPKRDTIVAMQDLWLMNICDNTMFPDADGAARQANLGEYYDVASRIEKVRRELASKEQRRIRH